MSPKHSSHHVEAPVINTANPAPVDLGRLDMEPSVPLPIAEADESPELETVTHEPLTQERINTANLKIKQGCVILSQCQKMVRKTCPNHESDFIGHDTEFGPMPRDWHLDSVRNSTRLLVQQIMAGMPCAANDSHRYALNTVGALMMAKRQLYNDICVMQERTRVLEEVAASHGLDLEAFSHSFTSLILQKRLNLGMAPGRRDAHVVRDSLIKTGAPPDMILPWAEYMVEECREFDKSIKPDRSNERDLLIKLHKLTLDYRRRLLPLLSDGNMDNLRIALDVNASLAAFWCEMDAHDIQSLPWTHVQIARALSGLPLTLNDYDRRDKAARKAVARLNKAVEACARDSLKEAGLASSDVAHAVKTLTKVLPATSTEVAAAKATLEKSLADIAPSALTALEQAFRDNPALGRNDETVKEAGKEAVTEAAEESEEDAEKMTAKKTVTETARENDKETTQDSTEDTAKETAESAEKGTTEKIAGEIITEVAEEAAEVTTENTSTDIVSKTTTEITTETEVDLAKKTAAEIMTGTEVETATENTMETEVEITVETAEEKATNDTVTTTMTETKVETAKEKASKHTRNDSKID